MISTELDNIILSYWLNNLDLKLEGIQNIVKTQLQKGARDEDILWLITGKEQPPLKVWIFEQDWRQLTLYPDEFKDYKYTGRCVSNVPVFEKK